MRKSILVVLTITVAMILPSSASASITKDQAVRVAKWYSVGLELTGRRDPSTVRILGCRPTPPSWLCQVSAYGETIVLRPDGTPYMGEWRFALRLSGSGCRVVARDAGGDSKTYRACPKNDAPDQ